jgi:hypothetical protein
MQEQLYAHIIPSFHLVYPEPDEFSSFCTSALSLIKTQLACSLRAQPIRNFSQHKMNFIPVHPHRLSVEELIDSWNLYLNTSES